MSEETKAGVFCAIVLGLFLCLFIGGVTCEQRNSYDNFIKGCLETNRSRVECEHQYRMRGKL